MTREDVRDLTIEEARKRDVAIVKLAGGNLRADVLALGALHKRPYG